MPFGLVISLLCHAALLGWAFLSMRAIHELPVEDTPAISAEIITPSEFLRLKQGSEEAKKLETKAKDEPKPDDSKNETKKPEMKAAAPPPPPPQEVAKVEPPPAPEPPKAEPPKPPEPVKPPEPDPIAKKIEEPPPPPEPAPGPTPDEQKLLQQKLEEEAKKKAEEEAKKKAEEEAKKKKAEEEKKRKAAEAKKKAEEAKKKFDPNKIANLLDKAPDDAQKKALIDKDPTKKGQQAAGTSTTATETGKEAGTATGKDTVLSAREQDLLKGMIKSQLAQCWRPPGTAGGTDVPIVTIRWFMKVDGNLNGEPQVVSAPQSTAGQVYTEAAVRAVKSCQPFKLPPESYEGGWKQIDWTFDPSDML